jgi:IS4 transposase
VSLPKDDEAALNRVRCLYAKCWRIESAYQSLKQFLIPTTSKSQELRFWYLGFASLLYSVWRLVNVILRERVGGDDERPVVPAEMVVSFVRRATGTG